LRSLLIHPIEKPEERDHEKPAADSKQPAKQTGHPTEARCGGGANYRRYHASG